MAVHSSSPFQILSFSDFSIYPNIPARRMNAETNMNRHRPDLEIQGPPPDMGRGDEIVIARHGYVA